MRILLFPVALACTSSGCLWISGSEHRQRQDLDGDGRVGDLDCAEGDPAVYVGALEIPCDGRDNDCNAGTPDGPAQLFGTVFATVQGAIDSAGPGDVVDVCPGTWAEAVRVDKAMTLQGAFGGGDVILDASGLGSPVVWLDTGATIQDLTLRGGSGAPNPDPSLIDGDTVGGCVMAMEASGPVVLSGLRVEDCTADVGAGIAGPANATLQIVDTVVTGSTAQLGGGGLVLFGGDLMGLVVDGNTAGLLGGGIQVVGDVSISADADTLVRGNTSPTGAGVYLDDGATLTGGQVAENTATGLGGGVRVGVGGTLSATEVRSNVGGSGGGVAADVDARIVGALIQDNQAAQGGGVLALGTITVSETTLANNVATVDLGGGLRGASGTVTLQDCVFSGNQAVRPYGAGGAVSVSDAVLEIAGGEYAGNSATHGGAVHAATTSGCPTCSLGLRGGVEFLGNTTSGDGGAVWSSVLVQGAGMTFDGNAAERGGGLYAVQAGFDVAGCLLTNNEAEEGGALYVDLPATTEAVTEACDLTGNVADQGAAIYLASGQVRVESGGLSGNESSGDAAVHMRPGDGPTSPTVLRSVGMTWVGNRDSDLYMGGGTEALPDATFTCVYPDNGDAGTCSPGLQ